MHLFPIPAFHDNYIWVLHDGARALVVDPGAASAVAAYLREHRLVLDTILITHHHGDHTGGVAELRQASGARVFGPVSEPMPEPLLRVANGDAVEALGFRFGVISVPGHTLGHIAFYCPAVDGTPLLFCGVTLVSAGCCRLFEGTPAQMHDSLSRLATLPDNTRVCCTHEYTLANLRFALAVEPGNADLVQHADHCQQLRDQHRPTLPSSMGLERRINPFLRANIDAVAASARAHNPACGPDAPQVFATLREWKNHF